jgi:hypothetical protein
MKMNKNWMSKILCACLLVSVIPITGLAYANNDSAESIKSLAESSIGGKDNIVLTVGIGSGNGELKYSDTMQGAGEGPEAFTVTDDETIYIVDNVNKRVNVYKGGKFLYDIATPYMIYVRSIVVSQELIYLMDYDAGKIYALDAKGDVAKEVTIPENMESYLMRKLYVRDDDSVWLYYENKTSGNSNRGVDYSYLVDDLVNGKASSIEGFTKDGNDTHSIVERDLHSASVGTYKTNDSLNSSSESNIQIATNEFLADIKILDVDKNDSVFVDVFEMVDTSIIAGEYTVRKYSNGKCEGIAPVDLGGYYFMPNNVLEVSEAGDLYQIKCYANKVQIIKKAFVNTDNFKSNIDSIKKAALALEAESSDVATRAITANAPNDMSTTMDNAIDCCLLSWSYKSTNASNPNSSKVTTPDYLVSASKPSDQTGIPYCWGGFDGLSTSSSSSWSSFSDAMSKNKFAGNVNTSTTGYQSGTAGFDCSGFVASTAGFSSKLSTTNLASSTYTKSISSSSRSLYDMYVKSGTHVLYYVGTATDGISSRESTTTGDDKTKLYTRSTTWLSGYSLRRFNGW